MKIIRKNRGITLTALVATVIILIILSGVTIGAVNGGLFGYAKKAKKDVKETTDIEGIEESYIYAKDNSKTGKVTVSGMQDSLDNTFGEGYAEAIDSDNTIIVRIDDKYYELDNRGKVGEGKTIEPTPNVGDVTKGGKCTGTESNPYRIECIEDLVAFSKAVCGGNSFQRKYFVLTKDLDFNSIFSYANYSTKYSYDEEQNAYIPDETSNTTIKELCTTGEGFIPIGHGSNGVSLQAFFNGQNHELKNLYIKRSGNVALLMGTFSGGGLANLTISGHIVSIDAKAVGFIQQAWGINGLTNCVNKAKIEGQTGAAGIVRDDSCQVIRCVKEGEIICHGQTGTVAAGISLEFNNTINKCYNIGKITNEGGGLSGASGICGRSTSGNDTAINCYNLADVESMTGTAGGITCWSTVDIKNCYNLGKVSGISTSPYGGVARHHLFW